MKRRILDSRTAPQATPVIAKMMKMGYIITQRESQKPGGDIVYNLKNPNNNFSIDFCTKRSVAGKDYVNWARVYGPDAAVDKFLVAVGYSPAPVKEVKTVQTTFNF